MRQWNLAKADSRLVSRLAAELKISPFLARLLVVRDISDPEAARSFLEPKLTQLDKPEKLGETSKAAEIILETVDRGEKILIHGDYDVDGLTSLALLTTAIAKIGGRVFPFVPNRFLHGYGVFEGVIDEAAKRDYRLLITVDCGITSFAELSLAKERSLKVIVTDHHQPQNKFPRVDAIVHPSYPDYKKPATPLAGVGVAFKLAQAFLEARNFSDYALKLLDLVALGTIADIAPLIGENRVMAVAGLELINSKPRPGIEALKQVSGLAGKKITSGSLAYLLAPRINAAGRLSSAKKSLELLLTTNITGAMKIAQELDEENYHRQQIEQKMLGEAQAIIEEQKLYQKKAIVIAKNDWHQGVLGIVASRLVEIYCRPAILLCQVDDLLKGSGRSVSAFDLYQALQSTSKSLLKFGGHKAAVGLSLAPENLADFTNQFLDYAEKNIGLEKTSDQLRVDCQIDLKNITPQLIQELEKLAPYGFGNPKPIFVSKSVYLEPQARLGNGNHLKFIVHSQDSVFQAVGFNLAEISQIENYRGQADIAYHLERDFYQEDLPQLVARDFKLRQPKPFDETKLVLQGSKEELDLDNDTNRLKEWLLTSNRIASNYINSQSQTSIKKLPKICFSDFRHVKSKEFCLIETLARNHNNLVYLYDDSDYHQLCSRLSHFLPDQEIQFHKNGELFPLYKTPVANHRLPLNLILYRPPADLTSFLGLVLEASKLAKSLVIINLLYNKSDLDQLQLAVNQLSLSRGHLIQLFRLIDSFGGKIDLTSPSVKEEVAKLFSKDTESQLLESLSVFFELGIAKIDKKIVSLISKQKVNLEDSPAYSSRLRISKQFEYWKSLALAPALVINQKLKSLLEDYRLSEQLN
jgi:single-stranded-DNA-specific exonuclease RecJ